jgi:putative flippase GtrA
VTGERWRFVLFVLAGATAGLVNILSRITLALVMPYQVAILVTYLRGMTTAFLRTNIS